MQNFGDFNLALLGDGVLTVPTRPPNYIFGLLGTWWLAQWLAIAIQIEFLLEPLHI